MDDASFRPVAMYGFEWTALPAHVLAYNLTMIRLVFHTVSLAPSCPLLIYK